jgi:hypothetical protein
VPLASRQCDAGRRRQPRLRPSRLPAGCLLSRNPQDCRTRALCAWATSNAASHWRKRQWHPTRSPARLHRRIRFPNRCPPPDIIPRNLAAPGVESRVQQCLFRAGCARSADSVFDNVTLRDFALRLSPLRANATFENWRPKRGHARGGGSVANLAPQSVLRTGGAPNWKITKFARNCPP